MGIVEKIRDYALSKGYYETSDDETDDIDTKDADDSADDYTYDRHPRAERSRDRDRTYADSDRRIHTGTARVPAPKVISMQANVQLQVVISYPETIDEAGVICDYIKSNKTVVVNLDNIKHESAQRIVDFLGGVVFALEGDIQYVSNKIFVVAPKGVDITGQIKEELKASGLLFNFKSPIR